MDFPGKARECSLLKVLRHSWYQHRRYREEIDDL